MSDKNSGFEVLQEQRQNWKSIAAVWIGAMICVACLMVGGFLGSGLTLGQTVLAILIGYSIIIAYMCLIGMQACDTGVPTTVMASASLGELGSRYIISIILAISCIGWFGINAGVCGSSFAIMLGSMLHVTLPSWIFSLVWGAIMLATACFGFKGLKLLNIIAVPLLLAVCLYGTVSSLVQNDGISKITNYTPAVSMPFVTGISLVIATFSLGGVIAGDYCRFAKSRADVIKSSAIGVMPAGLLMLIMGAVLSITVGTYDISMVLSNIGLPLLGLIALVAATWTTNVTNAYSGGLSLSVFLGLDEKRSKIATAIAGGVGTILAAIGFLDSFQTFLSFLCALVTPVAGIIIADYWIIGKGKKENFKIKPGFSVVGFLSFIIGALVACITGGAFANFPSLIEALPFLNKPFFVGPVNGIIISMLLYIILSLLALNFNKNTAPRRNDFA